jgi:hypothetical protein
LALTAPPRGLVTAAGFHVVPPAPVVPKLVDAREEYDRARREIGSYLDGVELAYNDILVLKYIPDKIGSVHTSSETQTEHRWQNKCGCVLAYGPTAKEDGFLYEAGDWVFYRPSDGQEIGLRCENAPNIALCLLLSPAHIIGKVTNPDLIW